MMSEIRLQRLLDEIVGILAGQVRIAVEPLRLRLLRLLPVGMTVRFRRSPSPFQTAAAALAQAATISRASSLEAAKQSKNLTKLGRSEACPRSSDR